MNTTDNKSAIRTKRTPSVRHVFEQYGDAAATDDLVTVCVSLYNYARFLPECLNSILAQRHAPIDLIVIDDASPGDNSVEVAEEWMRANYRRFHRTLLLSHVRNQGLAEARNTGFLHALGEYVFVIDADNMIYPRAISRLLRVLKETPMFAAAYTQLEYFGEQRGLGVADVWSKERFKVGNYVDAMALIRKETWRAVGGYTHLEGGWEDYDFWCKLIDADLEAAYVPEILCRYRVHGTSMLRTETNKASRRLIVEMTLRHPWLSLRID